jgi:peptidoglycan hydrolase CwlO-like protein
MSTTLLIINDIALLALFVCILIYIIITQRRIEKKISDVDDEHVLLSNYKEGLVNNVLKLEKAYHWINKDLDKKMESITKENDKKLENLTKNINELAQKNLALLKQKDEILKEVHSWVSPLKASLQKSAGQVKEFQDSISKQLEENENERRKLAKDFKYFTDEIKRMKDCIRERTIDFEL